MPVPVLVVDAFTDTAFAGNPAAVYLLEAPAHPGWMHAVAIEMNLPMTAFVEPAGDGFNLRWFMPAGEENLCGHATLATHALWQTGRLHPDSPARFHTRGGLLTATRDGGWIELDFPAEPVEPSLEPIPELAGLGAEPVFTGRSCRDAVVEVASEAVVAQLAPDLAVLGAVEARGVIVTSRASEGDANYVLRFFARDIPGGEDPVTGSAQCSLGPYWAARLGTDRLVARQHEAVLSYICAGQDKEEMG